MIEMRNIPLRIGSPEIRCEAIIMPKGPYIIVAQHSTFKPKGDEWYSTLSVAEHNPERAKIAEVIPEYYWGCEVYARVGDKSELVAYWHCTN